jgi:ATP-dependent RNA circularization protein (DNA/RNA ligase family)
MEYPKIHSLWKRQGWYLDEGKKNNPDYQSGRQSFIVGDYAVPEFANVKYWLVQEKIDGTNVRIIYDGKTVTFKGRRDDSDLPKDLFSYLNAVFTVDKLRHVFSHREIKDGSKLQLFGEGYGGNIQKAGPNYRPDIGFILFDVHQNYWWFQRDVKKAACSLGIYYAPIIGVMSEQEVVDYVKSKPLSLCSQNPQVMEGVVCRPNSSLMRILENGEPLMMKLKCREF